MAGISGPLIATFGTIAAAILAAVAATLTFILTKEQKTSEFRQAWIDELRGDLAKLLSAARTITRVADEIRVAGDDEAKIKRLFITKEKITEIRHEVAGTMYLVKLRLNQKEPDHIRLETRLKDAIEAVQSHIDNGDNSVQALAAIESVSDQARIVLKKEWERVKEGEKPYRDLKALLIRFLYASPILIVITVFIALAFVKANAPVTSTKPLSTSSCKGANPLTSCKR